MLKSLQSRLEGVFSSLKKVKTINEKDIQEGITQIRMALLEADVNYRVVKEFENNIVQKAIGQQLYKNVSAVEQFYKLVYDEILLLLGEESISLQLPKDEIGVIMLAGLQGSGKTTTASKLAYLLKSQYNVLLVGADVYRKAAKEQLKILAEKVGVGFYTEEHDNAVKIVKNAMKYAKKNLYYAVIIDTAGRLHLDKELMKEIQSIKKEVKPHEILFVADSMMGQNVVDVAKSFNDAVDISGVILTKFDSDVKAGAALSIKHTIGKHIRYIGVGEKETDLEVFHPERIASRILGQGDIMTLVEKTQDAIEEEEAQELGEKMMNGKMDFNDFLKQIQMIRKMGSLGNLMGMLPIPSSMKNVDENKANKEFIKMESLVFSMTPKERSNYRLIDSSRKRRITKGSGRNLRDLTLFMDQFQKMSKMVKKMSKKAKLFSNLDTSSLNLNDKFDISDLKKMIK